MVIRVYPAGMWRNTCGFCPTRATREALEERFWAELSAHEEAQKMSYVTSVERIGIKKGILQGEAQILQRQLQRRFGPLPEWITEKLAQADQTSLETWADRVLDAGTLEEVFAEG